jgi:hypothetical protein
VIHVLSIFLCRRREKEDAKIDKRTHREFVFSPKEFSYETFLQQLVIISSTLQSTTSIHS